MTSGFADHVEREARRILRQRIERLPWYPRMSPSEREAAIKADVDRYWRIMQSEAVQALHERHRTAADRRAA
jgi:hypothetical protein